MPSESTSGGTGEQRTPSEKSTESKPQRREQGMRQGSPLQRREEYAGAFGWPTPFSLMRRLFDDMDRMLDEYAPGRSGSELGARDVQRIAAREGFWVPQIDVLERDGKLVVRADLPGLSRQDVRAEIEDNALVLEGERRRELEEERGGRYRTERIYGSFRRVIPLPEGADTEHAEARFENGVLEVAIPLPEQASRRKHIEIREGQQTPNVH